MNSNPRPKALASLLTPCLVLDEVKFNANIARLQSTAARRGIAFRPHLKTAKSRHIARICADTFGKRAMVSTLQEIEQLRGCGLEDFLYSVAIVPSKFERVGSLLAADCRVTVAVDSVPVAAELVAFCVRTKKHIPAVIELDLDGHRSGVAPTDAELLLAIGEVLHGAGLLRGVMAHAGESYELADDGALASCARNEAECTTLAAQTLQDAGFAVELVTIGSTPTALSGETHRGVTELRAGAFVFFDMVQAGIGVCEPKDIAISVLATVIANNKQSGAVIIDAGWMALSRDRGTAEQAVDFGYGQVCLEDGTILADVLVVDAQQEHGVVKPRAGSSKTLPDLAPGTLLRILPNHACATAAQHDRYQLIGEAGDVTAEWPRFAGW